MEHRPRPGLRMSPIDIEGFSESLMGQTRHLLKKIKIKIKWDPNTGQVKVFFLGFKENLIYLFK